MVERFLMDLIQDELYEGKAILVFGPRQVGKTTALKVLIAKQHQSFLFLNADEPDVRESLENTTSSQLKIMFGTHKVVFIDEAQRVAGIGITLKLITDNLKDIQVIATGSSAFDLASKTQEALTGRKREFFLYPLSFAEMVQNHGLIEEKRMLEQRMLFGYYPEIVTKPAKAERQIRDLAESYLFKDVLQLDFIKKPSLLLKIVKALALQIGSEVSMQEISRLVGADVHTVEKYIDILEKAFVIFTLPALNRNVRNEIRKGKKIYFYDTGIRNALISNFNPLKNRTDTGALWENFVIAERMKWLSYQQKHVDRYFWRTTQQQEIDYLEEDNGKFTAVEFKWNPKQTARFSKTFTNAYVIDKSTVISPENIEQFICYE
jgi:predicted AAA+ superfamily ATPase